MRILEKIKTASREDARGWAFSPDPDRYCREWLALEGWPPVAEDLALAVLEAEFEEIIYQSQK